MGEGECYGQSFNHVMDIIWRSLALVFSVEWSREGVDRETAKRCMASRDVKYIAGYHRGRRSCDFEYHRMIRIDR